MSDNEHLTVLCIVFSFIGLCLVTGYHNFLYYQISNKVSMMKILDNFIILCAIWVGVAGLPILWIYSNPSETGK